SQPGPPASTTRKRLRWRSTTHVSTRPPRWYKSHELMTYDEDAHGRGAEGVMAGVVIVGGGPVGLWLAAELQLAGVEVVVLEQLAERLPYSRALTVYPRTLEQFAMRGLVEPLLAEGLPVPSSHFALLDNQLDFTVLSSETRYPLTLFLPHG